MKFNFFRVLSVALIVLGLMSAAVAAGSSGWDRE